MTRLPKGVLFMKEPLGQAEGFNAGGKEPLEVFSDTNESTRSVVCVIQMRPVLATAGRKNWC